MHGSLAASLTASYGAPIAVSAYREGYAEDEKASVRLLTRDIREALLNLTLEAEICLAIANLEIARTQSKRDNEAASQLLAAYLSLEKARYPEDSYVVLAKSAITRFSDHRLLQK